VYAHADEDAFFYLCSRVHLRECNFPSLSLTETPKKEDADFLHLRPWTKMKVFHEGLNLNFGATGAFSKDQLKIPIFFFSAVS
jgi:hypothetical protein